MNIPFEKYHAHWERVRAARLAATPSSDTHVRHFHVPKSTLDALEYLLRENDTAQLRRFLKGRAPEELAALKAHAAKYLASRKGVVACP